MAPFDELERAKYRRMRWNTPLSEDHADLLLDRLDFPSPGSVLDLGCGWGELLIRSVSGTVSRPESATTGVGVDTDAALLQRGRALAAQRGMDQRVTFVEAAAQGWEQPADRILCVGAAHAWGGAGDALAGLARLLAPGGRLLFGDGFWQAPPTAQALAVFGDSVLTLAELVDCAGTSGFRIEHLSTADQREWDEFESSFRAGRHDWLAAHPADPRAPGLRDELQAQLTEYLEVYRGLLGFCYLVLARD